VDGIVAVGDRPAHLAAVIAERLGVPFHVSAGVERAKNKFLARQAFHNAELPVPDYFRIPLDRDPVEVARRAVYPCVLKPLGLSGSRGVIRADDEAAFVAAFRRIQAILESKDIRRLHDEQNRFVQVEEYIPGREFALEGIVTEGRLRTFAIFDKPEPMEGPFFEETIYTTPSRECAFVQNALREAAQKAVTALGLTHGPVHAEMRHNWKGTWMLEVAGRPIGGLCSRALRFQGGITLEEVILRHALGEAVAGIELEESASGVMMVPIPRGGIYQGVEGVEAAREVAGIEDVVITAKEGQRLVPVPEGSSYLGFVFGRCETPPQVEAALREAHARLDFSIAAELSVV
jgi:biotin carboxylase